jgi:hypothetical protein
MNVRKGGYWLAQVKCQICGIKEDKILMIQQTNKKYYHIEKCNDLYIKENERKKEDNRKWSDLYEYLKVLHNVPDVPPRNIMRLKKELYESKGYDYELLLNAYKLCEDKIKWFIKDVLYGNCDAEGINKCISLMLNAGLNSAWRQREDKKKKAEEVKRITEQEVILDMGTETFKKKIKKDDMDITGLL